MNERVAAGGDVFSRDRGELRDVLRMLRERYGRRRLFRLAEVEAVVCDIANRLPPTPETVRRIDFATPRKRARCVVDLTVD